MNFVSKTFDFLKHERCKVIGEIGVNHNNDEDILFKLIDAGIEAGVDIIKFQKFKAREEISSYAPKADYQIQTTDAAEAQVEMAEKLELSEELLCKAFDYCKKRTAPFLCAVFDFSSVDFVAKKLGCKACKIPSPEITNKPLLFHIAKSFDSVILSTGASTLTEVLHAIEWMKIANPSIDIALMHCVSEYPALLSEINLQSMDTMRFATHLPVGFSDHTEGVNAAIVASALGAAMIEKHYTLDKKFPGPDHRASANISELHQIVKGVREAHEMLGHGLKIPCKSETKNREIIRKSLVYSEDYKPGHTITEQSFKIKRPFYNGSVTPEDFDKIVGLVVKKEVQFDMPIMWNDFK